MYYRTIMSLKNDLELKKTANVREIVPVEIVPVDKDRTGPLIRLLAMVCKN